MKESPEVNEDHTYIDTLALCYQRNGRGSTLDNDQADVV